MTTATRETPRVESAQPPPDAPDESPGDLPTHKDKVARRIPFFYGWVMLPIAMLAHIATSPGQTFGIAVFNGSFSEALGLSQSQLSGAYLLGTLLASLPVSLIGAIMDRLGMRRTIIVAVSLLGLACLLTSQVVGLISLFFAFLLLRMFGQGALTLVASNTLAMWFHDRLGTVMGMTSMAMAGAIAIIPPMLVGLINSLGWRAAFAVAGLCVWLLVPLLIVFYRNRPEDVGQQLDGREESHFPGVDADSSNEAKSPATVDLDLEAAWRTRSYWILLSTNTVWAMVATAIVFHIVPFCESIGLTRATAASTFTTFAIAMATMQLVGGMLADRLPLNVLLSAGVCGLTAGIFVLLGADSAWQAHLYAAVFGLSQGLVGVTSNTAWARYFGRTHLGKIRGSTWTAAVAGSSAGPFVMGVVFDQVGSYQPALWIFAGLFSPLVLLALWATPPRRPALAT